MILSPPERIADYTARGWWGTRRIQDWMDDAVRTRPDAEALVDAPNRADFIDGAPRRLTWRELERQRGRSTTKATTVPATCSNWQGNATSSTASSAG